MKKKHKIPILIITILTALSVLAISVSADYNSFIQFNPQLNQSIGSASNVFTVNGSDNPDSFSDEFSGGGNRKGAYFPSPIDKESYYRYDISRQPRAPVINETDDDNVYLGEVPTAYYIEPSDYYKSLQHDLYYTCEGKYSSLFNSYDISNYVPTIDYGLWESNNRQIPEITLTVEPKVTFLLTDGTKIEESITQATILRGNFLADVTTSADILEAVNLALDKAYATSDGFIDAQNGVEIAQSGRARLYIHVKAIIKSYGPLDESNKGIAPYHDIAITVNYPLTNSDNPYYPTSKTLPYNIVSNKIDSDFSLTEWLGASLSGIWRMQIIPHVTIGGIVTAVLGVAITIAFLKFFAGG